MTGPKRKFSGVIAAAPTPVTGELEPDLDAFVHVCRWLLDNGCDALNVCGTTGEATSFTLQQRMAIMSAAANSLPLDRLMTGTGAAAVGDAVALTRHAADLGYAGALLLPPFYYKGVSDEGILGYFERIVEATAYTPIDLFLYNFPLLSGVEYTPRLVERLCAAFGSRIVGLKDSSGNLDYAAEIAALPGGLAVFPSTETVLLRARAGDFAGCISGSANVTSAFCARAFCKGDEAALKTATDIRAALSKNPLIPSVKAALSELLEIPSLAAVAPPLTALSDAETKALMDTLAPLLD